MSNNDKEEENNMLSSLNDADNSSITKVEETSEEQEEEIEKPEPEEIPSGFIEGQKVIVKNLAQNLHEKGYFGDLKDPEKLHLTPVEAIFLVERKKLQIFRFFSINLKICFV